jgi:hypothetical protein
MFIFTFMFILILQRIRVSVTYKTIEFTGPLYNWLQQFTNHYLTNCHLPTGHSAGTILNSNWTPLYSFVLPQFSFSVVHWFCALL